MLLSPNSAVIPVRKRRNQPSGIAALFGGFCLLCTLCASAGAAYDYWKETDRSTWPVVEATVIDSGVARYITSRTNRVVYRIRCRVRFHAQGPEWDTQLYTPSSGVSSDIASMRGWVATHKAGDVIPIRFNPIDPSTAVFGSEDVPLTGPQAGTDLEIGAVFAICAAVLIAIARRLRGLGL